MLNQPIDYYNVIMFLFVLIRALRLQDSVERTIYKLLRTNIIPICTYM